VKSAQISMQGNTTLHSPVLATGLGLRVGGWLGAARPFPEPSHVCPPWAPELNPPRRSGEMQYPPNPQPSEPPPQPHPQLGQLGAMGRGGGGSTACMAHTHTCPTHALAHACRHARTRACACTTAATLHD